MERLIDSPKPKIITTNLLTIITSTEILYEQLDSYPYAIILNIMDLNNYTISDITAELSIHISQHLTIFSIPETTTIPQLKRQLSPHLVLILENPNPTETLITKFHTPKQIQILWLTNAPNIPNAYPPTEPNLASAIQEAINRFTET